MTNPLDKIPVRTSVAIEENLFLALPLLVLVFTLVTCHRRGKSVGYLVSVGLFWAYICGFAGFTIWEPWPLEIRPGGFDLSAIHIVPALLEGDRGFRPWNIQVWGNFLAGMPFGFAFPFIVSPEHCTLKRRIAWGLVLAVAPEFVQFFWNACINTFASRSVDIDDVWLCFVGTLFGYTTLKLLARYYVRIGFSRGAHLPVWNHFHGVLMHIGSSAANPPAQPDSKSSPNPLTSAPSQGSIPS